MYSKSRAFINAFSVVGRGAGSSSSKRNSSGHSLSRKYSTSSSWKKSYDGLLQSRVSFRLANAFYVGVVGTIVLYVFQSRRRKAKKDNRKSILSEGRFINKTVVITGGAGDIGSTTGLAFASEGAAVFLVDLPQTEPDLKKKCIDLEKAGAKSASYVIANVTNAEDVKNMVKSVCDRVEHIDIFFNNAGIQGQLKPLDEQDDDEFMRVISVNIYGVFLGMKYVSRAMKESGKGGVIVNTASLAGLLGPPNMGAYAASKFAVVGMTKTAAKDLALHGIRVCAIAPGLLEGKMWATQVRGRIECLKKRQGDDSDVTEEDILKEEARMIDGTPMKRIGKLSEVASVVTFLSSEDASYLTGVTVPIDGGRLQ